MFLDCLILNTNAWIPNKLHYEQLIPISLHAHFNVDNSSKKNVRCVFFN